MAEVGVILAVLHKEVIPALNLVDAILALHLENKSKAGVDRPVAEVGVILAVLHKEVILALNLVDVILALHLQNHGSTMMKVRPGLFSTLSSSNTGGVGN